MVHILRGHSDTTTRFCYIVILFSRNNTYNWWEARQFCEAAGGYLAQVGHLRNLNLPRRA